MKGFSDTFVEGIIKRAINGTITTRQAVTQLGVSKQYINKIKKKYLIEGVSCLKHGNRGKNRAWKTSSETEQTIINLYKGKYSGFNFRHFLEKLNEIEHISITYEPLYRILTSAGITSPKHQKVKNKANIHPTRPRKENFGELLQIDASLHNWFGSDFPKASLHGAVDDSTGTIMGLFFDKQETLNGYYNMLKQILEHYGIPESFYSDNRTIFEYQSKKISLDKDVQTQFRRCCQQLGISIITTSVPQAKGRIERLWGTLQSRLVSELSLHNIKSIEEANDFLPVFTADFNKRFARLPDKSKSRFVPVLNKNEINYYLSTLYRRSVDAGSSFKLLNKRFQLSDGNGKTVKIPQGAVIDAYVTFDKDIVAVYKRKFYETKDAEIVENSHSQQIVTNSIKQKWKPAPNHPWRKFVISSYKKRWKQLTQ